MSHNKIKIEIEGEVFIMEDDYKIVFTKWELAKMLRSLRRKWKQ